MPLAARHRSSLSRTLVLVLEQRRHRNHHRPRQSTPRHQPRWEHRQSRPPIRSLALPGA